MAEDDIRKEIDNIKTDYAIRTKTVGLGYRTAGIATTPIVQAPTVVVCKYYGNIHLKYCVTYRLSPH
jgi:hypothetical protein